MMAWDVYHRYDLRGHGIECGASHQSHEDFPVSSCCRKRSHHLQRGRESQLQNRGMPWWELDSLVWKHCWELQWNGNPPPTSCLQKWTTPHSLQIIITQTNLVSFRNPLKLNWDLQTLGRVVKGFCVPLSQESHPSLKRGFFVPDAYISLSCIWDSSEVDEKTLGKMRIFLAGRASKRSSEILLKQQRAHESARKGFETLSDAMDRLPGHRDWPPRLGAFMMIMISTTMACFRVPTQLPILHISSANIERW